MRVGDPITISSEVGMELNEIAGFSSIILKYPLTYTHPKGATIKKLLASDPNDELLIKQLATKTSPPTTTMTTTVTTTTTTISITSTSTLTSTSAEAPTTTTKTIITTKTLQTTTMTMTTTTTTKLTTTMTFSTSTSLRKPWTRLIQAVSEGSMIVPVAAGDRLTVGALISITSSSGTEVNEIAEVFVPSIKLSYPLQHSHPEGASIKILPFSDPLSQQFLQDVAGEDQETDAAGRPYSQFVGVVSIGLAWIL
mmetsp:Transcript_147026/g.259888  ORF Transcript_147026/g.259888 Transcript_147026/m.259888 type:complete len:253 (-) Transcript_147026:173-931(-)